MKIRPSYHSSDGVERDFRAGDTAGKMLGERLWVEYETVRIQMKA